MVWPFDSNNTPPDPNAPPDPGAISSAMANPWVSIPTAVGMGLLSSGNQATARLSNGLGFGLRLGMGAEKGQYDRQKEQRLSDALKGVVSAKETAPVTKTGFDPNTTSFDVPEESQSLSNGLAPARALPTYQTTEEKSMFSPLAQNYLNQIISADPKAAATLIQGKILREPEKPSVIPEGAAFVDPSGKVLYQSDKNVAVRPGGALVNNRTGQPLYQSESTDNWHPIQIDAGDKIIPGRENRVTGERVMGEPIMKGSAPARQLSPEDAALKVAETQAAKTLAAQRAQQAVRIAQITRDLKDPSMTKEKLNAYYVHMLRDRENTQKDIMMNPNDIARQSDLETIDGLLRDMRSRLAEKIGQDKKEGGTAPAPSAQSAESPNPKTPSAPKVGEVRRGYRFKGGDASKPQSWEKVQ